MGWAERLNPKSDWTLRNARRIIAKHDTKVKKKENEEIINKIKTEIILTPEDSK
jgi:hypothetical protein